LSRLGLESFASVLFFVSLWPFPFLFQWGPCFKGAMLPLAFLFYITFMADFLMSSLWFSLGTFSCLRPLSPIPIGQKPPRDCSPFPFSAFVLKLWHSPFALLLMIFLFLLFGTRIWNFAPCVLNPSSIHRPLYSLSVCPHSYTAFFQGFHPCRFFSW